MKQELRIGGIFTYEHIRDGKIIDTWEEPNLVVDEGLNLIINVAFGVVAKPGQTYVGIYANNYTPLAANVMSTFPGVGVAGEVTTEISNTTRPAWAGYSAPATTTKSLSNSASPAIFSFTAGASVNGAFLASNSAKAGTTGVLFAASKFPATRTMLTGDVLSVIYTISVASV